jgi:hypothetical protein
MRAPLSKSAGLKAAALATAMALLPAAAADAKRKRVEGQYATSTQPYWRVGQLNRQLSVACQRGEFGQRKILRMHIGYVGKQGRAVTGIATSTWNLYDPKRLSEPRRTYHFFNQGYSDCKVYVAETPRRPTRGTGQTQ